MIEYGDNLTKNKTIEPIPALHNLTFFAKGSPKRPRKFSVCFPNCSACHCKTDNPVAALSLKNREQHMLVHIRLPSSFLSTRL